MMGFSVGAMGGKIIGDRIQLHLDRIQLHLDRIQLHLDRVQLHLDSGQSSIQLIDVTSNLRSGPVKLFPGLPANLGK